MENDVLICWKSTIKWLTSRFPNPGKVHMVHILSDLLLREGENKEEEEEDISSACVCVCTHVGR